MNFKEALIAHLQGEKVEARHESWKGFVGFDSSFAYSPLKDLVSINFDDHYTFRLAPRTITVNGVEVPAPESVAPKRGSEYFAADPTVRDLARKFEWDAHACDFTFFERGLVYLNKDDAINRAKAMLITQEAV